MISVLYSVESNRCVNIFSLAKLEFVLRPCKPTQEDENKWQKSTWLLWIRAYFHANSKLLDFAVLKVKLYKSKYWTITSLYTNSSKIVIVYFENKFWCEFFERSVFSIKN